MNLSKNQVSVVENQLRKVLIETNFTFDDFLDHICCNIENKMDKGFSFDESMKSAFKEISTFEIIQAELLTLKLLNMETYFSKRTATIATIPFILFAFLWIAFNTGIRMPIFIELFLSLLSILSMFTLFVIGWIKDFPRWNFPAIGFCLLFSIYLMNVKVPVISENILGAWAWLPFFLTLLLCTLLNPSIKPIQQIYKKVKNSPQLIIFTLYGFVPFFIFLLSDEIVSVWMLPVILSSMGILILGLYIFLRSKSNSTRNIVISLSLITAIVITSVFCLNF